MFIPHIWHREPEPWEWKPAASGLELKVGTALAFSGGNLVVATGTTKPEFICMEDVTTTEAGQIIHVERIRPETEYETTLSEAPSGNLVLGSKYTLDANGERITATTTSGVATLTYFEGETVGSKCHVRFV